MEKIYLPTEADFRRYIGQLTIPNGSWPRVMLEIFDRVVEPSGRQYFPTENRKLHFPGPGIRGRQRDVYGNGEVFVEIARDDSAKGKPVFALIYIIGSRAIGFDTTCNESDYILTSDEDTISPIELSNMLKIGRLLQAQHSMVFRPRKLE